MAIASSFKDIPIGEDVVVFGEAGLSGEIRSVPMAEQRVREAQKLGFRQVILPKAAMRSLKSFVKEQQEKEEKDHLRLIPVSSIADVMRILQKNS